MRQFRRCYGVRMFGRMSGQKSPPDLDYQTVKYLSAIQGLVGFFVRHEPDIPDPIAPPELPHLSVP